MCGIAGYFGEHGSPDALRQMAQAIRRRGPDDEGFYDGDGMGFAFRRLSIIDVAGGHQPLSNEDGSIWVMLNGEIYGYRILRDELITKGHRFATSSDTETIVHAYEEWGDGCFEKLNGMFAIAIWDSRARRMILVRDRVGKKPLYWTKINGMLWFASEPKALLAAGCLQRDIDPVSLALYFRTDAVPTPRGIFRGLNKLEPASAMSWTDHGLEKQWSFWSMPPQAEGAMTSDVAIASLRETVDAAVRERLIADVPLGLFLSGGIDSMVVAESAARQSSSSLQAFTIGFEDASHDERDAASSVARIFGFEHRVEVLSSDAALKMLDEATECLDEPLADAAILPQLLLAEFTKKYVKVALSGDGGDELLLGYQHVPVHAFAESHPALWHAAGAFRHLASAVPSGGGYFSAGFKLQRLARGLGIRDPWARDMAWRGACTADDASRLLLPELQEAAQIGEAERMLAAYAREAEHRPFWEQWSWAYLRTFLMDEVLVKVDRATMWMGLEARSPLLDTRVIEAVFRIPHRWKTGAWGKKRLSKELLRDKVPIVLLNRSKHGFGVPVAHWLRGPLSSELHGYADSDWLKKQGIFESDAVGRLVREHQNGRLDRRKELWAFFMFQRWWRKWVSES